MESDKRIIYTIQPSQNEVDILCKLVNNVKQTENDNKKEFLGPQEINHYFYIVSAVIENRLGSKVVTLNLSKNEDSSRIFWERAIKLESYGTPESASWAIRIKSHLATYRKAMIEYENLLKSKDPLEQVLLNKIQRRAVLKCREIENKYSFQKYLQLLRKDSYEILSCSYSEDLVKEIGHTPDSFIAWTEEVGVPNIFDVKNAVFQNIMKEYINYTPSITHSIQEKDELETVVIDREGNQRIILVKFIGILEPSQETPFNHCYFVVRKPETLRKMEIESDSQLKKGVEEPNET